MPDLHGMPINTQPYGFEGAFNVKEGADDPVYVSAALERARRKLPAVRQEARVPPYSMLRTVAWLYIVIALCIALLIGIPSSTVYLNFVLVAIFLLQAAVFFILYRSSRPDTPVRAVRAWIMAVMGSKWRRVNSLTASSDRDDFPRRLPSGSNSIELTLSGTLDLERYWREVRHCFKLPAQAWMIHSPKVQRVSDRVAQVRFRLSTPRLPLHQFVLLIVLAILLVAVIGVVLPQSGQPAMLSFLVLLPLSALTILPVFALFFLWRNSYAMAKTVVYDGRQWRMFSGEWQAPEDRDLRWLQGDGSARA
jgi:hypothetical protein